MSISNVITNLTYHPTYRHNGAIFFFSFSEKLYQHITRARPAGKKGSVPASICNNKWKVCFSYQVLHALNKIIYFVLINHHIVEKKALLFLSFSFFFFFFSLLYFQSKIWKWRQTEKKRNKSNSNKLLSYWSFRVFENRKHSEFVNVNCKF